VLPFLGGGGGGGDNFFGERGGANSLANSLWCRTKVATLGWGRSLLCRWGGGLPPGLPIVSGITSSKF
jgi:hypothetical protein